MSFLEQFKSLCWKSTTISEKEILCDLWGGDAGRKFIAENTEKKAEIIEFIAKNKTDASEILSLFKGRYTLI